MLHHRFGWRGIQTCSRWGELSQCGASLLPQASFVSTAKPSISSGGKSSVSNRKATFVQ